MKAVLWTKYGAPDLLKMGEVDKPTPTDDELLVRIHAATVMPGDCEMRRFEMHPVFWLPLRIYMGIFKPKRPILGMELAGTIEAIGENVTGFNEGDEIIADTGIRFGAYAEYICLNKKNTMALKPKNMSFEEAATIPTSGMNALHYMRKAEITPGKKILIKGAAGCFGTYAVQIAKHLGAEVTGVDHTDKIEILEGLGADHVTDYTKEDFTKNGKKYDIIFDVVGDYSISKGMNSLTDKGKYILATPWIGRVIEGLWSSLTSKRKFIFELAPYRNEDLAHLVGLIEKGTLKAAVGKNYRLEEMVEAHEYVEKGLKTGSVTVTIGSYSLF